LFCIGQRDADAGEGGLELGIGAQRGGDCLSAREIFFVERFVELGGVGVKDDGVFRADGLGDGLFRIDRGERSASVEHGCAEKRGGLQHVHWISWRKSKNDPPLRKAFRLRKHR
jgi:hypothetical protein